MKILIVIPARYASTRFPGKPLAEICGKSMIQRVYLQATEANLGKVVVATDDDRIAGHVRHFGGDALLTGAQHTNGTSRCLEALEILEKQHQFFDVVINLQGDEPLIRPGQLHQLARLLQEKQTDIATLIHPLTELSELTDPNVVKTVTDNQNRALFFSRQAIPFVRNVPHKEWLKETTFFQHIGIYGFRTEVLKKIVGLPPGRLETAEKLEQLRWLENGYRIITDITDYKGIGIDTPQDLQKLINKICNKAPG
jgi:3-deoxy-manno-octulosonate cytidylyltransferase (CMP-KDO synthetase)